MTSPGGAGTETHLAARTNLVKYMSLHTLRFQYIHIPAYLINTSFLVSDCCILFAQVPVIFIFFTAQMTAFSEKKSKKMRPRWLCTVKFPTSRCRYARSVL